MGFCVGPNSLGACLLRGVIFKIVARKSAPILDSILPVCHTHTKKGPLM